MPLSSAEKARLRVERDQFEALQGRLRRGLALSRGDYMGKAQTLALARQYASKLPERVVRKCAKEFADLEAASRRPACARAPATVGLLRELLAGLPADTLIEDLPFATPEWIASVVKLVGLVPKTITKPSGPHSTSFGSLLGVQTPEELGL